MRPKVWLSTLLLVIFLISASVMGAGEVCWVEGTINTPVSQANYDMINYYVFNLSVANTNGSVVAGSDIPVACALSLVPVGMTLQQGGFYNFTGAINTVQTGEFPVGTFNVTKVNVAAGRTWWDIIVEVIKMLSSVMSGIASTICALIQLGTGWLVPEIAVTIALVALLTYVIIKNIKTLSIVFIVVIVFLIVSGGANFIRLLLA